MMKKSNGKPREHKALPIFVTKVDEALGQVTAIVSVMGVIDYGNDVIHNGAYTKTISERKGQIRVLDQHNTSSIKHVLGKPLNMREIGRDELPKEVTDKYPMATGGLEVIIQFNMKVESGREAFFKIEAGDVNEYSIGYDALDVDFSEVVDASGKKFRVRNLRTIRLWEVSPVIWGMNPATTTVDAKGVDGEEDKEMGADGPVSRLGDYMHSCMVKAMTGWLTNFYGSGFIDDTEFAALMTTCMASMQNMRASMPDDIALRPLSRMNYYYELSRVEIEDEKDMDDEDQETKDHPDDEHTNSDDQVGSDEPPTDERVKELLSRAELLERKQSILGRVS